MTATREYKIERDSELFVWSTSPEAARRFFGLPETAQVRVVQDGPQTTEERERYSEDAKLFAIRTS